MEKHIKTIQASEVYGHFDINFSFDSDITIFYGKNGGGKTTLLQILTNALNSDFERFAFLKFKFIRIEFVDGRILKISRNKVEAYSKEDFYADDVYSDVINVTLDDEVIDNFSVAEIEKVESSLLDISGSNSLLYFQPTKIQNPTISTAYMPAFRNIVDANKSSRYPKIDHMQVLTYLQTEYIRRWLLPFVPKVNFPSLSEIEKKISREARNMTLSPYLIEFITNVNDFLEHKKIEVNQTNAGATQPILEIVYEDGWRSKGLESLSSGERQITTILYAATQLSGYKILLIDEPEISLHIDWQRLLVYNLSKILSDVQIIVCTHSPVIGADFDMVELPFSISSDSMNEEIPI